jgi:hypothetical protein
MPSWESQFARNTWRKAGRCAGVHFVISPMPPIGWASHEYANATLETPAGLFLAFGRS